MYVYLSTIIVEESNVHANKASQRIEKEEWTPLVWPHRESKRELETHTPPCNKNLLFILRAQGNVVWILLNISSITYSLSHIRNMQLTVIKLLYRVQPTILLKCNVALLDCK